MQWAAVETKADEEIAALPTEAMTKTPTQAVLASLENLEKHNDPAMFPAVRQRESLLAEAMSLEAAGPDLKPLYGMVFAVKDNIDVEGLPTTAACAEFSYLPTRSAHVVETLQAAGAIVLGKTNLDQFATGLVGVRAMSCAPI